MLKNNNKRVNMVYLGAVDPRLLGIPDFWVIYYKVSSQLKKVNPTLINIRETLSGHGKHFFFFVIVTKKMINRAFIIPTNTQKNIPPDYYCSRCHYIFSIIQIY